MLLLLMVFPGLTRAARISDQRAGDGSSYCRVPAVSVVVTTTGTTGEADTTRVTSDWQERVRRLEALQTRVDKPRRDSLEAYRWKPSEKERWASERCSTHHWLAGSSLAGRLNLTRWATLTVAAGVEWRIDKRWGVLLDGAWTSWSWRGGERRYALWNVSPEARYYPGGNWHAGVFGHFGEFNYKLGTTGRQGHYTGGGVAAGYRVPLGRRLTLDFDLGAGFTRAKYDKYILIDGTRVQRGKVEKNRWGVNRMGINLEFKI